MEQLTARVIPNRESLTDQLVCKCGYRVNYNAKSPAMRAVERIVCPVCFETILLNQDAVETTKPKLVT